MEKAPKRELRFNADKSTGKIEIIMLADGMPIPLGSILYTQAEAESFARQLVEAIEIVHAGKAKSGLIIPNAVH